MPTAFLCIQIRLYKRAGMANAVMEMQEEIEKTQEERSKERDAKQEKLLKQKTLGMEMRCIAAS